MFSFSRTKVIGILILVVSLILAAVVFFIFQNRNMPAASQPASNNKPAFSAQSALPNAVIFPPQVAATGSAVATSGDTSSKTKSSDNFISSFLDKTKRATQEVQRMNAPTFKASDFDIKKSTVTPAGIILNIEPDEFTFIYPQNFLDSLQNIAQPFIQGEAPGFVALAAIKTDADVRIIEEKLIDALFQAGIYKSEQVATARETIRFTLPRLQLIDLKIRAQEISFQEQFKNKNSFQKLVFVAARAPQFLNFVYAKNLSRKVEPAASRRLFFGDIIDQLKSVILPAARAACGSCADSPECYQGGAAGPEIGSETFRVACQCSGCLSGLGCLDGCGSGVAAIFDPVTRICGCGL
ncbi:MAG: hypothetical protein Q8P97_00615 [bacterium]|nr:hypothetical protein [bacterium]